MFPVDHSIDNGSRPVAMLAVFEKRTCALLDVFLSMGIDEMFMPLRHSRVGNSTEARDE